MKTVREIAKKSKIEEQMDRNNVCLNDLAFLVKANPRIVGLQGKLLCQWEEGAAWLTDVCLLHQRFFSFHADADRSTETDETL